MTSLQDLVARLEGANGPDREIDIDIARLRGVTVMMHDREAGKNYESTHWHYTSSLDAALSLVPEGYTWAAGDCNEDGANWACITEAAGRCRDFASTAATVPVALCIAALKARLADQGKDTAPTQDKGDE